MPRIAHTKGRSHRPADVKIIPPARAGTPSGRIAVISLGKARFSRFIHHTAARSVSSNRSSLAW